MYSFSLLFLSRLLSIWSLVFFSLSSDGLRRDRLILQWTLIRGDALQDYFFVRCLNCTLFMWNVSVFVLTFSYEHENKKIRYSKVSVMLSPHSPSRVLMANFLSVSKSKHLAYTLWRNGLAKHLLDYLKNIESVWVSARYPWNYAWHSFSCFFHRFNRKCLFKRMWSLSSRQQFDIIAVDSQKHVIITAGAPSAIRLLLCIQLLRFQLKGVGKLMPIWHMSYC